MPNRAPNRTRALPKSQAVLPSPTDEQIAGAVRKLRGYCEQTQAQFAKRLGSTSRTITRYETNQPPKGQALIHLWSLAWSYHLDGIAAIFSGAYLRQFWDSVEDSGFMDSLLDRMEELFKERVGPRVREQLIAHIRAEGAAGRLNAAPDEIEFMKKCLEFYRSLSPQERSEADDLSNLLSRSRVLAAIEQQLRNVPDRLMGSSQSADQVHPDAPSVEAPRL